MGGYGVYSCRFGNIYTSAQLLQLGRISLSGEDFKDPHYSETDLGFIDLLRPNISSLGFQSLKELTLDRKIHLAAVRRMFSELDVFVFTLGLTEGWRDTETGAVFPICPLVIDSSLPRERYEFFNFDFCDIRQQMIDFVNLLNGVNAGARIILTVSPVALAATFEEEHVLVANTYSKSTLRSVAGSLSKEVDNCYYFPSFEIITSSIADGRFFEDDFRTVRKEGVGVVMENFYRAFNSDNNRLSEKSVSCDVEVVMAESSEVICDEDLLG